MQKEGLIKERPPMYFSVIKENFNDDFKKREVSKKTASLKRIPLEKLMDLKIDYAFKQLFGNEKNKKITIAFLNAILQKSGRHRVKEVTFLYAEIGREYEKDKESRLDLLVLTDADERINVEIQFSNKYDMVKRSIYYWSQIYTSTLGKGMEYKKLRPVIVINILNYDTMTEIDLFHTIFHLRESVKNTKLTDVMEFHFIEMTKLINDWKADKLDPWNNVLARWLLMLGMIDGRNKRVYEEIYSELEEIAMQDETLRDAFTQWEELSLTEEQFLAYQSRLKRVLDEESYQATIKSMEENLENKKKKIEEQEKLNKQQEKVNKQQEEANKQQEEANKQQKEANKQQEEANKQMKEKLMQRELDIKGREQNVKHREEEIAKKLETIAINLLKKGMDIDFIMENTGLGKEEIDQIQRNINE